MEAIFSLAGKNRGGYDVFVVRRAGKRLPAKLGISI